MARARRQHWMDSLAEQIRQRAELAIPAVAAGVRGEVPFGYEAPKRNDEVRAFLNMTPEQRQQMVIGLGPEGYRDWSESMMGKLTTRFGPAAQVLFPMLQGAPIETVASGVPSDDGSLGVAAAQADIAQLLGFDPFEEG